MRGRGALLSLYFGAAAWGQYLPAQACAGCHREVYERYQQTAMGRSFRSIGRDDIANFAGNPTYYHEASDQHFSVTRREGQLFVRRDGDVVEMRVDFVLGSGEHAKTYLHRTAAGRLIEIPLGWYRENGGTWAMNPGYDRPEHMDFRRKIDRECFFCHNAYPAEDGESPELFLKGAVPEGIDCQRCHGPGGAHVRAASSGRPAAEVRGAIVNPARLPAERQNEVCFQCHLESTSARLPYAVRKYGRGFLSYRPGEPLGDYILHFDRAGGGEGFEIDHAGYRLLQSKCVEKDAGALRCARCHDPHGPPTGEAAAQRYETACRSCHGALPTAHPVAQASCVSCHMAKRRTEDAVHVVMTDHAIRRVAREDTAPRPERHDADYRGEVVLLYPRQGSGPDTELYVALAQVKDGANPVAGIPRLRAAIEHGRPTAAEFYFELADAHRRNGQAAESLAYFAEALRRKPGLGVARVSYGQALMQTGRGAEAIRVLEAGSASDAAVQNALGAAYLAAGRAKDAEARLRTALRIEPDLPEALVNLGNALSRSGARAAAITALQAAIRQQPGSAAAHNNVASLLDQGGDFAGAREHWERAIRLAPEDAAARYNYGRALLERKLYAEAETQLAAAVRLDAGLAEASVALGLTRMRTGRPEGAVEAYRAALRVKPGLTGARFNLALALIAVGERTAARRELERVVAATPGDDEARLYLGRLLLEAGETAAAVLHLEIAAKSGRAEVRAAAEEALRKARAR